jgi:hypothetical protein
MELIQDHVIWQCFISGIQPSGSATTVILVIQITGQKFVLCITVCEQISFSVFSFPWLFPFFLTFFLTVCQTAVYIFS